MDLILYLPWNATQLMSKRNNTTWSVRWWKQGWFVVCRLVNNLCWCRYSGMAEFTPAVYRNWDKNNIWVGMDKASESKWSDHVTVIMNSAVIWSTFSSVEYFAYYANPIWVQKQSTLRILKTDWDSHPSHIHMNYRDVWQKISLHTYIVLFSPLYQSCQEIILPFCKTSSRQLKLKINELICGAHVKKKENIQLKWHIC